MSNHLGMSNSVSFRNNICFPLNKTWNTLASTGNRSQNPALLFFSPIKQATESRSFWLHRSCICFLHSGPSSEECNPTPANRQNVAADAFSSSFSTKHVPPDNKWFVDQFLAWCKWRNVVLFCWSTKSLCYVSPNSCPDPQITQWTGVEWPLVEDSE